MLRIESLTTHTTSGGLPTIKEHKEPFITQPQMQCSSFFISTVTKRKCPIWFPATCTTSNVMYLITCTKCRKHYMGYTTTQLGLITIDLTSFGTEPSTFISMSRTTVLITYQFKLTQKSRKILDSLTENPPTSRA